MERRYRCAGALNVHDIIASDGENETSTFCAYYASDRFSAADLPLLDALQLRLGQGSLDDGPPNAPIRALQMSCGGLSIAKASKTVLMLRRPLKSHCTITMLATFSGAVSIQARCQYQFYENNGPNNFSLELLDNGMRIIVEFREQNVGAKLNGTLGNQARIRAERITIDLTFDVGLRGDGQPDISLRRINRVSVGDLDANFSGILGFVLEIIFEAFEGLIRDTITDAIRDFLVENVDRVLTDLLSNVDIGAFGQGIEVPSLVGGEPIEIVVNAALGRLDFRPGSATIGVNAQVSGPDVLAAPGIGVVIPGEDNAAVPADRTVGALIKLSLLNQVMYRLWRAGYFEAEGVVS